jgi:tetrahydromethanopterin:alpha-L-glutamate ligase
MRPSADRLPTHQAAHAFTIALVSDRVDWHARGLIKALAAFGARAILVRLEDCRFETYHPPGAHVPGFDGHLPDAVLVRTMSGGSFEAVTLRLGILHALRDLGVSVWNDARAIERCVDKSMTSFLLARAGIPTPPTWVTESAAASRAIVEREPGPFVLKPLFGSQGRNLRLIRSAADLPEPGIVAGVYYLQRFVGAARDGTYRDFRLLVSQGRVVAAMIRHASHWITNVKRGGKALAVVPDLAMKELAVGAAAAVGANFAGVDIIHDADGGPTVLEVNSMPAWSALQKVAAVDIAATLAADLVGALAARTLAARTRHEAGG